MPGTDIAELLDTLQQAGKPPNNGTSEPAAPQPDNDQAEQRERIELRQEAAKVGLKANRMSLSSACVGEVTGQPLNSWPSGWGCPFAALERPGLFFQSAWGVPAEADRTLSIKSTESLSPLKQPFLAHRA